MFCLPRRLDRFLKQNEEMTIIARNIPHATRAIRATAPQAIRAGAGTISGNPAPIYAFHRLAGLRKVKEPVSSSESFTLASTQGTQHRVQWQYSHTEDVRVDPRAAPQSPVEAAKYVRAGYMEALGETRTNDHPTESEQDVVADRSGEDPLPPAKHHTIQMPQSWPVPNPTESEANVAADRAAEDPLAAAIRRAREKA